MRHLRLEIWLGKLRSRNKEVDVVSAGIEVVGSATMVAGVEGDED
jgi:hypothetical protein